MELIPQILAAAQAIEKAGARLFRPHGVTVAQFNVLNLLADTPDGQRASDLARALVVDPSNVTGLLARMTKEGWLEERENAADRRQRITALSAKGRRLWRAAHTDYQRALESFESGLTVAERKAAVRVLAGVITASQEPQP